MSEKWWSENTVALVTGANRGVGFEIVRLLAEEGLSVVLTARDKRRGQAAVDDLHGKGLKRVAFHHLDATSSNSIATLAVWLKSAYGGLDILINNAGIQPPSIDYESAKTVLETNYYGVTKVTTSLLQLLRPSPAGARIVQVTSRRGMYERLQSESIKAKFRDEDSYTEDLADSLATQYLEDMNAGRADEKWMPKGKPGQIYGESKMFMNVYSSALAKSLAKSQKEGHEIFVAGMCPGAALTEMLQKAIDNGRQLPEGTKLKSAAEGADTAVWLALLPKEEWQGKSGKFFGERIEYQFGLNPPSL